jgi:hypothetical protein
MRNELRIAWDKHLQDASIILLLVSPDFLASDYCYSMEMQWALERHHTGESHVIPILLRPTDWQSGCQATIIVPDLDWDGQPCSLSESQG